MSGGLRGMITVTIKAAPVLVAGALGGCDASAVREAVLTVARVDSGGVELVVNRAGYQRVIPFAAGQDSFLLDESGEPFLFTGMPVWAARTLRNGTTAIIPQQQSRVALFDAVGRHAGYLGSRGGGPGEFRLPLSVVSKGDTVSVYDPMRLAVQRWVVPAMTLLPQISIVAERQGATMLALAGERRFVTVGRAVGDSSIVRLGWENDSAGVVQFTFSRGSLLPLPCMPFPERRPPLLSPRLHAVSYEDVVAASGSTDYRIVLLKSGRVWRVIRREVPVRTADRHAVSLTAGRGIRASMSTGETCSLSPSELADAVGAADVVPAIQGLSLTADGSLWVQRTLRDEEPSLVDQFDSTGAYVRTLEGAQLPIGSLPDGRVLFPIRDEDTGGIFVELVRLPDAGAPSAQ